MNWFVLAVLAGIASNIFNIFNRSSLKQEGDSTLYSWLFEVFRFCIFLLLFSLNPSLPTKTSTYWWLLLLGLNEVVSVYFFMKSHKHTKLSISTFIVKLQLIWTPILAGFFIGERLAILDYAGILLILIGIYVGIYSPHMKVDRGIMITFISSIFISLNAVFVKGAVSDSLTPFLMMAMSLPAIIIFPFLMKNFSRRVITMPKPFIMANLAGVVANVIAMGLAVSAIRIGSTSKVTAVYQGMMIVAILYGIIILKEKESIGQKILGTIVTLLGLFLLT